MRCTDIEEFEISFVCHKQHLNQIKIKSSLLTVINGIQIQSRLFTHKCKVHKNIHRRHYMNVRGSAREASMVHQGGKSKWQIDNIFVTHISLFFRVKSEKYRNINNELNTKYL